MKNTAIRKLLIIIGISSILLSCGDTHDSDKLQEESNYVKRFNTVVVHPSQLEEQTSITGRVIAAQQIEVVAQVQGIARSTRKAFKPGERFKTGEPLVWIDDTEFRNNLIAQKSQFMASLVRIMSDLKLDFPAAFAEWQNYLDQVNVTRELPALPEASQPKLRYFLAANNIYSAYYNIKSQEETLSKYIIKAPFDGVVAKSAFDAGALIRPNTQLGSFFRTDQYEILASVSAADIPQLTVGDEVHFTAASTQQSWPARVKRISQQVDAATQAVSVYFITSGAGLKEGMYLEGQLKAMRYDRAVEISRALMTRNHQVYLISDSLVQLKSVEPLAYYQDKVIVRGLAQGDLLITDEVQASVQGIKAAAY